MSKQQQALSKLEFSASEKKVWLVKVPNFLAHRWTEVCDKAMNADEEQGPELAKMRLVSNAAESSSDFQLTLTGADLADIPIKEYSMRVQRADMTNMHVFSDQQGRPAIEGKVEQKLDVNIDTGKGSNTVLLNKEYRELTRKRNVQTNTKTRTVQMLDDPRNLIRTAPVLTALGGKRKGGRSDKTTETKRSRMEKDELERLLFTLFEKQAHWTFSQLQRESDQPAAWLKEVLAEVALLNKKGPHKDLYEVKKEYKRQARAENAAAS